MLMTVLLWLPIGSTPGFTAAKGKVAGGTKNGESLKIGQKIGLLSEV